MKLSGNTILVTGGTSGIGQGFAIKLSELGNKVIVCGRRQDRLNKIKQNNPDIIIKQCDLSQASQRLSLTEWVTKEFPNLNMLINNAGIQLTTDLTKPLDLQDIYEQIEINLVAPIHLNSLLIDHLKTIENAAIINISSGLGFVPIAFMPVYCATKAAVHSITLSLRKQLEKTSIKVFEIAPPSVDTELGRQRREDTSQYHGGMSVSDFINEAIEVLKNDDLETGIGSAANLIKQRELMFDTLNH